MKHIDTYVTAMDKRVLICFPSGLIHINHYVLIKPNDRNGANADNIHIQGKHGQYRYRREKRMILIYIM